MGEALSQFVEEAQHLSSSFDSATVFSIAGWDVSQYVLYMFIALVLVLLIVLISGRKLELIPHKKFTATVEYGYNFIRESVGADVIGEGFKKHIPFLATLFFMILIANVIGLIPGAKAAMGTISITWALAAISFIYFNFYGLKELGVFRYMKSFAPSGVPAPMVPVIWFLEFVSMVIRVLTLAVRLYGNMLAGHMVLADILTGNHHLLAVCGIQYGLRNRTSCSSLVLLTVLYVCSRNFGCILAGICIHHPVFFLHRHGNPSSLIKKKQFWLAPEYRALAAYQPLLSCRITLVLQLVHKNLQLKGNKDGG